MIYIEKEPWNDEYIEELAKILFVARKKSSFKQRIGTISDAKSTLVQVRREDYFPEELFIAYDDNKAIIGFCMLYKFESVSAQIWNWHPVALPGAHEDQIALRLISAVIEDAKSKKKESLSIDFPFINENQKYYEKYRNWFDHYKFQVFSDELCLELDIRNTHISEIVIPKEFEIRTLPEVDRVDLFECRQETFLKADYLLGYSQMSEQERKESFLRDISDDGSLILMKKGTKKIIGFLIAKINPNNEVLLTSLGITPKYRRKGLAEILMKLCIQNFSRTGVNIIKLYVEFQNNPAVKLYRKFCFSEKNRILMLYKRLN